MSTVHFIGGEKGGVGKSVVARLLTQSCIDKTLKFAAIDADTSHGALLRYYAGYSRAVDLEQFGSADQIMDRALGAERQVIVDLPAQSLRAVLRWMDASDVQSYAQEMGVNLVFWHVSDGGFDSVAHLGRVVERLSGFMDCVFVKNYGRSSDFSQFDLSPMRDQLLQVGGRIAELPELDPAVMYKLDRFGSSFWAAINADQGEWALSPMERRRAKLWLERATAALDSVGDWFERHALEPDAPAADREVRSSQVVPRSFADFTGMLGNILGT